MFRKLLLLVATLLTTAAAVQVFRLLQDAGLLETCPGTGSGGPRGAGGRSPSEPAASSGPASKTASRRAPQGRSSRPKAQTASASRPKPATSSRAAVAADTPEDEGAAQRCEGRTKKGKRCSRDAEPGSSFCWQHGGG